MRCAAFVERHLILLLALSSGLALAWPEIGVDPFASTGALVPYLVAVTMLCIGWMLPVDEVREVFRRWPAVLGGVSIQYITMPLLAWLAAEAFQLGSADKIGVILVGAVPGAMASNVLTLNARGNTSYSVGLTATATMLSPLVTSLVLMLALRQEHRPNPWSVFANLTLTVALPVTCGHALRRLRPQWRRLADNAGPLVANLTILWIIAVVVGKNRDRLFDSSWALVAPLLTLNLLGYLAGYRGAALLRLPEPMRRALTLEVGMQNAGVGTSLALTLFADDPRIALAPAMYTFGCMLTGAALARWWRQESERIEDGSAAKADKVGK